MNLLCLNCGDRFVADDSAVGIDGATIKCVHCGLEQPIYTRRKVNLSGVLTQVPSGMPDFSAGAPTLQSAGVPTPPESASRPSSGAGFRKPMSSIWAGAKSASSIDDAGDPTVKMAPPDLPAGQDLTEPPSIDDGSFVIGGLAQADAALNLENSGGPFTVRSPAALAFEFPDFQVLDEWARSIDKLEKYTVVDSFGAESLLSDFLRKRKAGGRSAAVKAAMRITGEIQGGSLQDSLMNSPDRGNGRGVSTTNQFEFKVVEEKKRGPGRAVVLGILGAVVVISALTAAILFYFR